MRSWPTISDDRKSRRRNIVHVHSRVVSLASTVAVLVFTVNHRVLPVSVAAQVVPERLRVGQVLDASWIHGGETGQRISVVFEPVKTKEIVGVRTVPMAKTRLRKG